jgi:hypothetical protein
MDELHLLPVVSPLFFLGFPSARDACRLVMRFFIDRSARKVVNDVAGGS